MRNRFISFTVVLLALCFMAAVPVMAQRVVLHAINDKPHEYITPKPYDGEYDAHDLSGIWFRVGGDRSHGPARTNPPLTAAGIEEMKKHKPTRSNLPEITPAVADPKQSNYPAIRCNPKGYPAIKVDDNHDHHEIVQLPNRILELWQEEGRIREIWLDGRAVPSGR